MEQLFTLLLWAHARAESEERAIRRVLDVYQALRDFGPELSPTYEAMGTERGEPARFEPSAEHIRRLIEANRNREGGKVFPELGSRLAFFSDREEKRSAGISMDLQISNARFRNVLAIQFPTSANVLGQQPPFTPERISGLFKRLVEAWEPYWGACINRQNARHRFPGGYVEDGMPRGIHWFNLFGPKILEHCDLDQVRGLPGVQLTPTPSGVILRLQEPPVDDENPAHVAHQERVAEVCFRRPAG